MADSSESRGDFNPLRDVGLHIRLVGGLREDDNIFPQTTKKES